MWPVARRQAVRNGVAASKVRQFSSSVVKASEVQRLGVVGAGQMVSNYREDNLLRLDMVLILIQGLGIALVAAQKAQVPVKIIDSSQASIDRALKFAG